MALFVDAGKSAVKGVFMVKHIVLWSFLEDMSPQERRQAGEKIRDLLEPIGEKVDGALEIRVVTDGLPTGNRDVALISGFESQQALAAYQEHPDHLKAKEYIGSVTCNRSCIDYEC